VRKILLAFAATTMLSTALLATATTARAADTASVSVVHGIPDTPVNVFVNGAITLKNFKPGTVAGPLQLAPGDYQVTIFAASNVKGTGKPVISASATLESDQNVSLVAHLDADGAPTLTPYVNDTSPIAAGETRLVVRHNAAAPAVDVRANGEVAFADLTNPKEATADLPAGSIEADVVLAGTSTVVIGPATLDLREGSETIVYAIGSAEDTTLAPVVQTISQLGSPPAGVPAGSGGTASQPGAPLWVWLVTVLGIGLLTVGGVSTARVARVRR
jgi:uncharacterized protein DUF4397